MKAPYFSTRVYGVTFEKTNNLSVNFSDRNVISYLLKW
jgi:hypothetical protein